MSYRTKSDNEPFDSYREFLDNISRGGEVVFYYNENKYTLTHGTDNDGVKLVYFGIVNSVSEYKIINGDFDVIGDILLDGSAIREIVTEFKVEFRCF